MTRYIIFSILLLVQGCASLQQHQYCDVITAAGLPILHPDQFEGEFIRNQLVRIQSRQMDIEFISQLEVRHEELILVALAPIGQKLFQIQYKNGTIQFDTFGIPVDFDPAYLLADISLMYGRPQSLRRCLSDTGLQIQVQQMTAEKREFRDALQQTILVDYQDYGQPGKESIHLHNQSLDYQITIKTLEFDRL